MDVFVVVVDHEEKVFFYSEGEFADQYYVEFKKVEKYEFYSEEFLMEFSKEQQGEYGEYSIVGVTSY
ncbi:hypothetical protein P4679_22355 [Priestia megaterium]|uniref:hypothetical protein n=1 Tax=Priestia megaterium TaxID=1404 RepID=UPI002E24CF8E|nr:hypothetical protein [Priestia megaterium]